LILFASKKTSRKYFTNQELKSIEPWEIFHWSWVAALGHSGGILMGFRDIMFEIGSIYQG
jgi:hypothetical protein